MKDKYKVTYYFNQDAVAFNKLVEDLLEILCESDLELFEVMNDKRL